MRFDLSVPFKYLNTACTAFLRTFIRLRTQHGHVSNVLQTHKHRTDLCRTFRQYSTCTQHVTRVNLRHPGTMVFLKVADKLAGAINWSCSIAALCIFATHRNLLNSKNNFSGHDCNSSDSNLPENLFSWLDTSHFHQNSVFFHQRHCIPVQIWRLQQEPGFHLVFQKIPFELKEPHLREIEVLDPSNSCFYFREEFCRSISQVHFSSHNFGLLHIQKGIHLTKPSSSHLAVSTLLCVTL